MQVKSQSQDEINQALEQRAADEWKKKITPTDPFLSFDTESTPQTNLVVLPRRETRQDEPLEDAELASFSADDAGNADAVKHVHGDSILYTREYGWLIWNGKYWEEDEESVRLRVVETLRRRRIAAIHTENEKVVQASKADQRRIQGCLSVLEAMVRERVENFDSDPDSINVSNGVLHLPTLQLTPHNHTQRYTYCLETEFKPEADYSEWEVFLLDSVKGGEAVVNFLQEALGYSITGHTREEKMLYAHGPTRAGKGTTTETLSALLGKKLSANVAFNTFTRKRDSDQGYDLAPLKPARLIIASESNRYEKFNGSMVKEVTGGGSISCAFKHKDFFTYTPKFKILLTSNWPINGDPDDDALWGRIVLIEFPTSHIDEEDMSLKARLKSKESLEGLLLWLAQGAKRWYEKGRLIVPDVCKEAKQAHRDQADPIGQWLEDECEIKEGAFTTTACVRASYTNWCNDNGHPVKGARAFNESLRHRGLEPNHQHKDRMQGNAKGVLGLRLLPSQ